MSFTFCPRCQCRCLWAWEEAFDKFGFNDGDGVIMTEAVAEALRLHGYTVTVRTWGLHNEVITAIELAGTHVIPRGARIGYDDPREYLPGKVIALLDQAFPDYVEVRP